MSHLQLLHPTVHLAGGWRQTRGQERPLGTWSADGRGIPLVSSEGRLGVAWIHAFRDS